VSRRLLALLAACAGVCFHPARAADLEQQDIEQLLVMIDARIVDASRSGAGIILGFGDNALYVATANHLVRDGKTEAEAISVRFRWRPDRPVKARLLPRMDAKLDLAVLRVDGLKEVAARPDALPFDRLGDAGRLKKAGNLFLLGNPQQKAWRMNVKPEQLSAQTADELEFESAFIAPGHSGGALLDDDFNVVGMLKSDTPPYGEAVSIARILEAVRGWGYPVHLGRPPVPRFSSVSVGRTHACALSTAGSIYCWGLLGTAGIASRGSSFFQATPTRVRGGLLFRSVSAGTHYTCAVAADRRAYCWGNNGYGQLGTGSNEECELPTPVLGDARFNTVHAGDFYTCGIAERDGDALCWGSEGENPGWFGRKRHQFNKPRAVPGGFSFRSVSPNPFGGCGITTGGQALCWGPELGGPDDNRIKMPVRVPTDVKLETIDGTCMTASDGSVRCLNEVTTPDPLPGLGVKDMRVELVAVAGSRTFRVVSGGIRHSCGIDGSGQARCWGLDDGGSLGKGESKTAAADRNLASTVVGGLKFQSISAGFTSTCGVTTAGDVYCWGVLGALPPDDGESKSYGASPTRVAPSSSVTRSP
jgi:alpha-tubulin suppressor-like RCC1 family protein